MRFARARRGLAVASIAATVASAGLASVLPAGAATGTGVRAAHAGHSQIVVITCANRARVMPSRYVISCADANSYLAGLSWRVWGWRNTAYGHGTNWINDCTPTCAKGKFHGYQVLAVLWQSRPLPGSSALFSAGSR